MNIRGFRDISGYSLVNDNGSKEYFVAGYIFPSVMEEASVCKISYLNERREQGVHPQHHFLWAQQYQDRTRSSYS